MDSLPCFNALFVKRLRLRKLKVGVYGKTVIDKRKANDSLNPIEHGCAMHTDSCFDLINLALTWMQKEKRRRRKRRKRKTTKTKDRNKR